ncbi:hypothetical protein O5O45_04360 [Hahella aquimaris]|uniref:hypothetical protein n=1 Tax=Hahella sp. HNIBRBA332 TaxID=3015983 RepID=UPI00273CCF36|nr:hypothetical protein [Hahella sp. HNIBRBA332]WLQ15163.1 hypothetical protein O5O45_04360 [Hahella sp. HNIBRBA332]
MNQDEIRQLIIQSADTRGFTDRLLIKELRAQLAPCAPSELFEGLYSLFLSDESNYRDRQELAGRLLYKLYPRLRLDLRRVIKDCLATYYISVEQLPQYLVLLCGIERVVMVVNELAATELTERERISLNVFKFWLGMD